MKPFWLAPLLAAAGTLAALPDVAADDDALIGIWSHEANFGTPLQGELTVVRRSDSWRAAVGNASIDFEPKGNDIRFAFPNDAGRFRGTLGETGHRWLLDSPRGDQGSAFSRRFQPGLRYSPDAVADRPAHVHRCTAPASEPVHAVSQDLPE